MAYKFLGWSFLAISWQPIAILGTALAFIVGFKNNASYGRIWEARQIYGAIINDSRSFGYTLRDAAGGKQDETVRQMFYRHFAWLTALRFQLREPRNWENMQQHSYRKYRNCRYVVPEWPGKGGADQELSLSPKLRFYRYFFDVYFYNNGSFRLIRANG